MRKAVGVQDRELFFNHKISTSYERPVSGCWNEPETHYFLNYVISRLPSAVIVVDVGANMEEMIISVSKHRNISQIFAFELILECSSTIKKALR